jgi:hypothetical protein
MKAFGPGGVLGINCPTAFADDWKKNTGEVNNTRENSKTITGEELELVKLGFIGAGSFLNKVKKLLPSSRKCIIHREGIIFPGRRELEYLSRLP